MPSWKHIPTIIVIVFVPLLLTISGTCQKIQYESAAGTDFSRYKTYKWQRVSNAMYPDQATDQILVRAIDEQLVSKGLTKTEAESADLYVTYQLLITENAKLSSFSNDIQWQGGANSLPGFKGSTTTSTIMSKAGSLMVDLYDANKKAFVWQAIAEKGLGKGKDPRTVEQNTRKVMAKVFEKYPSR